ncbi:MAG: hypothetical protein NT154_47000, partial [Verrucomicrobia bacterium]|nr:hypothetical protein [Verrucomicrobiota bacterium]
MIFKLILLLGGFPLLEVFAQAHDGPVHATLAEYAGTKAALLDPPLFFTSLQTNLLQQGAVDEDSPVTRCLAHAWNPLTG